MGNEEWVAIGTAYGVSVRTGDAEPVEIFEAKGFKAKAEIIDRNTGLVVGGAEAYCLDNEQNWLNKDYYQMASMAQTRASSKALSNQLKGVVALYKSLSSTPAEEMHRDNDNMDKPKQPAPKPSAPKPQSKPQGLNSSNLGNKPKPKLDDGAIEVEATEVKEEPKSFKEICDSNKALTTAVQELQSNGTNVNPNTVRDKLLDLWDMGKVSDDEYQTAKALLE